MPTNPNTVGSVVYSPTNSGLGTQAPAFGAIIQKCINIVNGVGTQWLALSTYPGVDPTGVLDSQAAVKAAIGACAAAQAAGNPLHLLVDCPVRVTIGIDASKTMFLPNNLTIRCVPGTGYFITDPIMLHLFDIINMTDVTFVDLDILYTGNFGDIASDQQNPADSSNGVISSYNDTYGKGFMASPVIGGVTQWTGITFTSGGSYAFPSSTNACALISISGQCDKISFLGKTKMRVPSGVLASFFIPTAIQFYANWSPGLNRVGNPPPTVANGGVSPQHVYIEDMLIDGCYMGIVGTTRYFGMNHLRGQRYSDIQDSNGENIGGKWFNATLCSTAPLTGGTTINLSSVWAYTNQSNIITFSNGTQMLGAFVNGSANVNLSAYNGGVSTLPSATYSTTVQVTYSAVWFAPPHLLYLHQLDFAVAPAVNGNFPMTMNINSVFDEGIYVGTKSTRSTNSGYLNSIKFECANGSYIGNYVTLRPHGGMDLLSFGALNGIVNRFFCQMDTSVFQNGQLNFTTVISGTSGTLKAPWPYGINSQTYSVTFSDSSVRTCTFITGSSTVTWSVSVTANATANIVNTLQNPGFGRRMPSTPPLVGVRTNFEIIDTAAVPAGFAIQGDGQQLNTDLWMFDRVSMNDWPLGASWSPGYGMGGSNINIDCQILLKNCSSASTFVGSMNNSALVTQSSFKYTIIGWRATQILFTGTTIASGATSATFASNFPYTTGTYGIAFSDGENRQVSCTNGATTATWSPALTATVTNIANISLMNGSNLSSMKQRVIVSNGGLAYGNRVEIIDTTNCYTALIENNVMTERYVQDFQGSLTGATYTVPITLPSGYSVDAWGWRTTTALTGVTGATLGISGTPALISTGTTIGTTVSSYAIPAFSPIAYTGNQSLLITSTGGTLTGGVVNIGVSVKGMTMVG